MRNACAVLGVQPHATPDEIRKAYKELALRHHPDKNAGREERPAQRFQEIVAAYSILTNATKRIELQRSMCGTGGQSRRSRPDGTSKSADSPDVPLGDVGKGKEPEKAQLPSKPSTNCCVDTFVPNMQARALKATKATAGGIVRIFGIRETVHGQLDSIVSDAQSDLRGKTDIEQLSKKDWHAAVEAVKKHEQDHAAARRARLVRPGKLVRLASKSARRTQREQDDSADREAIQKSQVLQKTALHLARDRAELAQRQREDIFRDGISIGLAARTLGTRVLSCCSGFCSEPALPAKAPP
eukprot:TRINITY_DN8477_c0_g1_i4.p1 TRINITY_DN8477_c0_g1~~TRINITY_DN8477_c0_g1_i4.p1  ORF type:complete len:298 (+),score=59.39 TRINITY_DN8477_c0_g1_i4:57-950(+)